VLIAGATVVWAGITSVLPSSRPASRKLDPVVGRLELEGTLARIGINPTNLTAAGFTVNQAQTVAAAGAASVRSRIEAIRVADNLLATAQGEYARLRNLIQSGRATEQDRTAYAAARIAAAQARSAQASVLDSLFQAATTDLPAEPVTELQVLRTNSKWNMDAPYLSVARTEAEWVALRDALADNRISSGLGATPDPRGQALLTNVNADPMVSAARTNIQNNLDGVTAAWNQAIGF